MKQKSNLTGREVYVVDGSRTPFLKGEEGWPVHWIGFGSGSWYALIKSPAYFSYAIDEVIIGSAMPGPDEANIARVIALRLGCGDKVPAFTVMRNCASGMQAIDNAALQIASGRSDLVLAGGTDAMSHAPLLFNEKMAAWLARWFSAQVLGRRLALITAIKSLLILLRLLLCFVD